MKRLGAILCLLVCLAGRAAAQEAAPTPTPAPAAGAGVGGLPDIEKLRAVGSSANLIPGLTAPAPDGDELTRDGQVRRRNGRGGGAGSPGTPGGNRPRSGRPQDVLAARAGADPLELRVAYRRDKTEALRRNPELLDLLQRTENADSEPEKRAGLKEYYTRLFAAVREVDPSPAMKQHVKLLSRIAEQRYSPQRRAVGGEEELVRGQGGGGRRGRAR